jgi:DNA-binding LacI/PurR family transcriptional regulator
MRARQPVLKDIAARAGVSTATVSRALNNSPLVTPEVRDRIQSIASDLNYRIHAGARNLRRQRTEICALIIRSSTRRISDPFFSEFAGEISVALRERGYDLLIVRANTEASDDEHWIDRLVGGRRVDGLIVTNRARHDPDLLRLADLGEPFVVLGHPLPGQSYRSCGSDNDMGGYLAGRHLIALGHRHLAVITGTLTHTESGERFDGFQRALSEAGIALPARHIVQADYRLDLVQDGMERLLALRPAITGVFVASDLMAIAAVEVIGRHGLVVPDDISVVGFDDIPLAAYFSPPLTTVRQEILQIGRRLAEQLVGQIEDRTIESETVPVRLIVRSTTAPPNSPARSGATGRTDGPQDAPMD